MGRDMPNRPALAVAFPGLSRPVLLHDAPALLSALGSGLAGWSPTVFPAASAAGEAVSTVVADGAHHAIRSPWLDEATTGLTAVGAFCGVVADLSQAWVAERPDHLALHAGGVVVGGRLIALAGEARAGKSTLIARLTMEPWAQVLCDDVLPVDPAGRGVGLGIPPRLRLPLPARTGAAFRAHVAAHLGPFDSQYAYLSPDTTAPHGTQAPLAALVVLTRRPKGRARLHHLSPAEALAHLVARNITMDIPDPAHVERLAGLAAGIACLRLVYADPDAAVALIRDLGRVDGAAPQVHPALPASRDFAAQAARPVDPRRAWRRAPGVGLLRKGAVACLWQRTGGGHFALDPIGQAVWTLLQTPVCANEIAVLLAEVFAATSAATIAADVAALLGQMQAAGLIEPAPDRPGK